MRAINGGRLAIMLCCLGMGLALSGVGVAQTSGDDGEPTYEEKATALLAEIEASAAEARRLSARAGEREGEFRRVMQRRAEEAGLSSMASAHDLARLVIKRQEANEDPGEFRAVAAGLLEKIDTGAQAYLKKLTADPSLSINADTSEMTPADLAALEGVRADINERVVAIYQKLITNLELSRELGVDATDQEAYLSEALAGGAEMLSVSLELALDQEKTLTEQLASVPDDADLMAKLRIANSRVDRLAGTLSPVTTMLDTLELDASAYKQQLIEVTGSVTTDIFDIDVLQGLAGRWLGDFFTWIVDNLPQFLFDVLLFVLVLWIALALSRLTRKLVTKALAASKFKLSRLLRNMIIATAANLVLLLGLLFGLAQIGISVGPLLAGLGIAGFIVGFALQDTLGNFASGMMILLYRPYDVGDLIEAGGVFGKVSHMSLVNTTVLTLDNQTLVMPNSKIWGDVIKNVTAQRIRRVDMVFGIGYSDDIPKAEKILTELIESHDMVLDDPEPMVRLHTLGESSVDFIVRPWVKTEDYWDVYWDVTRAVKMRFDEDGISIPFPQRDVHIFSGDDGSIAAVVPARIEQAPIEQGPVAANAKDSPDAPDSDVEDGDGDGGEGASST
jgi:small conductance mechanosensitive channel